MDLAEAETTVVVSAWSYLNFAISYISNSVNTNSESAHEVAIDYAWQS